jgi:hypothetical protein
MTMASKRKAIKARAQRDDQARLWATHAGRVLALDLYHGRHTATRPYGVGVVLDHGETAWSEVPVRFNRDWPPPLGAGQRVVMPAIRPWLVTSGRVVGRLADHNLYGYRWETMSEFASTAPPAAKRSPSTSTANVLSSGAAQRWPRWR